MTFVFYTTQSGAASSVQEAWNNVLVKALTDKHATYLERFGLVPCFKAGVHIGMATVGEIGVIKKDIV